MLGGVFGPLPEGRRRRPRGPSGCPPGDLLEAEPDIRVIGEAGTASAALARIPALRPDVAVLDATAR